MANTISVGLNIGDFKAAGNELLRILQNQAKATVDLAEAQAKYNKSGQQVGAVLRGMSDEGDKYTVTLKQIGTQYELVNSQVIKAKASLSSLTDAQRQAAAESRALQREMQQEAAAALRLQRAREAAQLAYENKVKQFNNTGFVFGQNGGSGTGFNGPPTPPPGNGVPNGVPGGKGVDDLAEKTDKARASGERLLITWQGVVRLIEAQLVKKAINEIGRALIQSVDDAKRFSIAIAEIQTISQDVPVATEKWRTELTKLSGAFGVSQLDVAAAAYETLSNQTAKGTDTFKFLETALKFGAATVSSTKDSVNLLSGAINSFRLPVEDAERVASILFKTIELGRVKAKDLADTFGRVGALAGSVGIKIEEVGAAIATISVKGVTPAETLTLINNVILKLLKPTEEMKKLFDEWGVSSGQAAIATFGFGGVLQKLSIEAEKGGGRLGALENNIRALRGAMALTGPGFQEYQKNLDKINNGGPQDYKNAQKKVLESPGKQLEIGGQQLKNLFTENFGKGFVDFLNNVNGLLETSKGSLDGFKNGVELIIKAVSIATIGLVTYQAVLIANNVATAAATVYGLGWSVVLNKLTVDWIALRTAMSSTLIVFTAFAAAGFVIGEAIQHKAQTVDELKKELQSKQTAANDKDPKIKQQQEDDQQLTRSIKQQLDTRYQLVLQYSAKVVQEANRLKQRTVDNYKDITDSVKITAKTYFDSISGKISSLRQVVSEADSLIKASLKRSEDYRRTNEQTVFDTRLKYADAGRLDAPPGAVPQIVDDQKSEVLQNRINVLLKQARQKAASPDKETFEESKKLYDDVQRLQAQLFAIKTDNEKRVFDEKVNRGQVAPTKYVIDPRTGELKAQYQFIVQTTEYEKQLNSLADERLSKEKQFRQVQRERAEQAEKEVAQEKERLRLLQQAFTAIEKIEVFNKAGDLDDSYKKDPKKATREFDEQAAKIRALAGKEGFGTQFQVFADLQKQRQALVQQVEQAIRLEQAKTAQESIIRNKEAALKQVDEAGSTLAKSREITKKGLDSLDADLQVIKQKVLAKNQENIGIFGLKGSIPSLDEILNRDPKKGAAIEDKRQSALRTADQVDLARRALSGDRDAVAQVSAEVKQLSQERFEIYEAAKNANNEAAAAAKADRTPENLAKWKEAYATAQEAKAKFEEVGKTTLESFLKAKIDDLRLAVKEFAELKTGQGFEKAVLKDDPNTTIKARTDRLGTDANNISNGGSLRRSAFKDFTEVQLQTISLSDTIKNLPGSVDLFRQSVQTQTPVISQSFSQLIAQAEDYVGVLARINEELRIQGTQLPQERGNRDAAPNDAGTKFFGGEMSYFDKGGPVFKPRGQDTVPAMLNKDEFVMTAAATKKFAPLLRAMNAGPTSYMSGGGSVTNVGDVNVSVQGGDTSEATIKEIGVGLRRAIARGQVKIHG